MTPEEERAGRTRGPAPGNAPEEIRNGRRWNLESSREDQGPLLETHHQIMDSYREGTIDQVIERDREESP